MARVDLRLQDGLDLPVESSRPGGADSCSAIANVEDHPDAASWRTGRR